MGIHSRHFTDTQAFKRQGPNDYQMDQREKCGRERQCHMISEDLRLAVDKLNADRDRCMVLDKLGFLTSSTKLPTFQIVGWHPFRIAGTSVCQITSYCDCNINE